MVVCEVRLEQEEMVEPELVVLVELVLLAVQVAPVEQVTLEVWSAQISRAVHLVIVTHRRR